MIKKAFPVLALSVFSSMLGAGIIAPLLPLYAENLGASGIWIGIIFSSFSITRAIFMPLFGWLSDRNGRKFFICMGLLSYSVVSLGYIWADGVVRLTLVRLLHGTAGGMIFPIAQAYVGDISPVDEEGRWMGYFNAAFLLGFGFGPLMGGAVTEHFGMNVAFSAMGGLNLLAFLIAALFLPDSKRGKMRAGHVSSFRQMSTSGTSRGLFCYRLAFALGRGTFTAFLPIFAGLSVGLSPGLIGTVLGVNILLMSLFQVCAGRIADRLSRRLLVVIGGLILVPFLAFIPSTRSFWQLLGLCALGGLGGAVSLSAASALMVEEGRRFGMGSAAAMFTVAMSIGMAIGPILSGLIVDLSGVEWAFYLATILTFAGTVLFAWFSRNHPQEPQRVRSVREVDGRRSP